MAVFSAATWAAIAAVSAVVGAGSTIQQGTQTKKAGKSAKEAKEGAANQKILEDKEAKVAEQTSLATGQEATVNANDALQALGAETQVAPGSAIGGGNAKKTVIGA